MILQPIAGRAYYIPGANNLGIVVAGDGGAVAIDTGLDKDTGRLIRKALDEAGLTLRAIISTHHHADHIGGNDFLLRNLPGVEVYAPPLEAGLIEHPVLEPVYLSMGAVPIAALQNKWLMARGSPVHHLLEGERQAIAGVTFDLVPLAGHSLNQIGVAVDGICFAADGFFGPAVLQKHGIPYAQDVAAQLVALDRLAQRGDNFFLPGHGELLRRKQIKEVLDANRAAIQRGSHLVRAALSEPGTLASVARRVRGALGLELTLIPQYAIFLSAISAHLSYLAQSGLARAAVEDEGIVWRAAPPLNLPITPG